MTPPVKRKDRPFSVPYAALGLWLIALAILGAAAAVHRPWYEMAFWLAALYFALGTAVAEFAKLVRKP